MWQHGWSAWITSTSVVRKKRRSKFHVDLTPLRSKRGVGTSRIWQKVETLLSRKATAKCRKPFSSARKDFFNVGEGIIRKHIVLRVIITKEVMVSFSLYDMDRISLKLTCQKWLVSSYPSPPWFPCPSMELSRTLHATTQYQLAKEDTN